MRWVPVIPLAHLASSLVPGTRAAHIGADGFRKGSPFSKDGRGDAVYDRGGRITSTQNPSVGSGGWLDDGDVVIGSAGDGVARAYPPDILNWEAVVNDPASLASRWSSPAVPRAPAAWPTSAPPPGAMCTGST